MGLFSGIADAVGSAVSFVTDNADKVAALASNPVLGAGVSLASGALARRAAGRRADERREAAREDERTRFQRLRRSAELGGFSPLEVLKATGGVGFNLPSGVPPLASSSLVNEAFRGATDALGRRERQRDRELQRNVSQAELRLAELRVEKVRAGDAGSIVRRTQATLTPGQRSRVEDATGLSFGDGSLELRAGSVNAGVSAGADFGKEFRPRVVSNPWTTRRMWGFDFPFLTGSPDGDIDADSTIGMALQFPFSGSFVLGREVGRQLSPWSTLNRRRDGRNERERVRRERLQSQQSGPTGTNMLRPER